MLNQSPNSTEVMRDELTMVQWLIYKSEVEGMNVNKNRNSAAKRLRHVSKILNGIRRAGQDDQVKTKKAVGGQ